MKQYHATIIGDRYPIRCTVEASSWSTAASRAVKQYQNRFKRSHSNTISIRMVRLDRNTHI